MQQPIFEPLRQALRSYVGWLMALSFAANVLMLAVPLHMIQVYDRVLPTKSIETLVMLTALVVLAMAVGGVAEALRSIAAQKLSARYELTLAPALLTGRFLSGAAADVAQALRDVGLVRQMLGARTFVAAFDLPFAPLFFALLFLLHPALGIVTFAGAVLLVAIGYFNTLGSAPLGKAAADHQGRAARFAGVALRQNDDVRTMGMTDPMIRHWEAEALSGLDKADRNAVSNAIYFGLSRFVRQSLQVVILALGAYLVLIGHMSAGLIFAASLLSGRALMPIEQMIGGWRQWQAALSAHRAVGETLGALLAATPLEAIELPAPTGALSVRNVSYKIDPRPDAPTLLDDISLEVRPGDILAVIGPSGAGKSTLARIMAGALSPSFGQVRLDGFSLDQWDPTQRGRAIGYVGQSIEFLEGTVADNIARFDPAATDAGIVAAAKAAHAHGLIATMPAGYRTPLGPGGVRLSGGQTQRLALARAFYGAPRLLILDEPNAHLDSDGETALVDALNAHRATGGSAIVITQRSALLGVADKVAVIRGGKLETIGPRNVEAPRAARQAGARFVPSFAGLARAVGEQAGGDGHADRH